MPMRLFLFNEFELVYLDTPFYRRVKTNRLVQIRKNSNDGPNRIRFKKVKSPDSLQRSPGKLEIVLQCYPMNSLHAFSLDFMLLTQLYSVHLR